MILIRPNACSTNAGFTSLRRSLFPNMSKIEELEEQNAENILVKEYMRAHL
jgi:hypothetical protein